MTGLADGGYVVTWTDASQSGTSNGLDIYSQRYDAWDTPVGSQTPVNNYVSDFQSGAVVTGLPDGGYITVWTSYLQDGDGYGVYSRRFDDNGFAQGTDILVTQTTAGNQLDPTVTSLADGGYIIAWRGPDFLNSGNYDIYSRRYDAAGIALGGEMRVNTTTTGAQVNPVATALADGGYVLIWTDDSGNDGDAAGIFLQQFDSAGVKVGGEILAVSTTAGDQANASVTGLTEGGYVVVWDTSVVTGGYYEIYSQVFDGQGHKLGPEQLVNSTTIDYQDVPNVAALADGGYVVSWTSVVANAGEVYQKVFAPAHDLTGSQKVYGTSVGETLNGGSGPDQMFGGAGDDTYIVDNIGDRATELAGNGDSGGNDLVQALVSFTLGVNVEKLLLGGTGNLNGTGNGLANTLAGNTGNNVLNGLVGADTMYGKGGNDTYYVDNLGDRAVETDNAPATGGTDTVVAAISWTLGSFLENLTLTGAALSGTGNDLNNLLIGNGLDNSLTGGLGADTMQGGLGNDSYTIDSTGDVINENAGEGTDTVMSGLTWTLGTNLERLVLTGTSAVNGIGNTASNALTGNSAANVLTGLGGNDLLDGKAGADSMVGGLGDDTYYVDNIGDVTTEAAGEGYDSVFSSVTRALGTNLEDLTLTGVGNISRTGNASDNLLRGNTSVNILKGMDGNDFIDGQQGNDRLYGGLGADLFFFGPNSGADTIYDFAAAQAHRIDVNFYSHGTAGGGGVTVTPSGANVLIDLGLGNTVLVMASSVGQVQSHIIW